MKYVNESDLSSDAQRKAQAQPEGHVVFARRSGRGWKISSVEPSLVELAKAQGGITDEDYEVRFGR